MPLPRKVSGCTPGQLDPNQPSRILRSPRSVLLFASFDPLTASTLPPGIQKQSLNDELYRPKRIVVETLPSGERSWRFVPSARKQQGVMDEGNWPRVIRIHDELVEFSQDQWDIYKLDPLYDCYVPAGTAMTTISLASSIEPDEVLAGPSNSGKRNISTEDLEQDISPRQSSSKRRATEPRVFNVDDDSEEEDEMSVDGRMPSTKPLSERARKFKEAARQERREKLARREEKLMAQDSLNNGQAPGHANDSTYHDYYTSLAKTSSSKRKVPRTSFNGSNHVSRDVDPEDIETRPPSNLYTNGHSHKRQRTTSPQAAKRDLEAKKLERERRKKERREQAMLERRKQREEQFMQEIINGRSTHEPPSAYKEEPEDLDRHDNDSDVSDEDEPSPMDEERTKATHVEESIHKMREFEKDRPIWEAAARERLAREQAEERAIREEAEARRRAEARHAEQQKRAAEQHEAERKRREEAQRQARDDAARRERERKRQQERFSYGVWTPQRALERYRTLCETFDSTKFSDDQPLSFDLIPWPVLHSPVSLTVEDVDWSAVEKFFESVRPHMRVQDFTTFVEKSHRRFHPDRWRSRRLLVSIADEGERNCIEVATNTVAQALTPIWISVKGK